MQEAKSLYERSSETLLKKAQALDDSHSASSLPVTGTATSIPIIVGPAITQQKAPIAVNVEQPVAVPQEITPTQEGTSLDISSGPTLITSIPSPETQALIDQILQYPDVLQQIFTVTPEQEANWTEQERMEMTAIRLALRERGYRI